MSLIMDSEVDSMIFDDLVGDLVPPCEAARHPEGEPPPAEWVLTWITTLPCGCRSEPKVVLICQPCHEFVINSRWLECQKHIGNRFPVILCIESLERL